MPLYSRSQRISSRTKGSGANTAPIDFDPATHPILSLHWFGTKRSIQVVNDQKLDTYTELDPEAFEAAGGKEFWQPPLHGVRRVP